MPENWLELLHKTKQGKLKKTGKKPQINVFVLEPPARAAQASRIHTGAGPDGVVQPDRVAAFDMGVSPPTALHEDEIVDIRPDGTRSVTPSPQTQDFMANTLTPSSNEQQAEMIRMEKGLGTPGFKGGGRYGGMPGYLYGGDYGRPADDESSTEIDQSGNRTTNRTANVPTINPDPVVTGTPNYRTANVPTLTPDTPTTPAPQPDYTPDWAKTDGKKDWGVYNPTPVADNAYVPDWAKTDGKKDWGVYADPPPPEPDYTPDWAKTDGKKDWGDYADPTPEVLDPPPPVVTDKEPTVYETGSEKGYEDLLDYTSGDAWKNIDKTAVDSWNATAMAEANAYRMQVEGDPNLTPEMKKAKIDAYMRNQRANRGAFLQNLTSKTADKMYGASQDVHTLGRGAFESDRSFDEGVRKFDIGQDNWQKNFDEDRKRYDDDSRWKAYDQAIASGDYDVAAGLYSEITGKEMDPSKLEEQYQWKKEDRAFTRIQGHISAGDYDGANEILTGAGLPSIDFSKVESNEHRELIGDIDGIIDGLGPDADPGLLSVLAAVKMSVLSKAWSAWDIDPKTMTVTDPVTGNKVSAVDLSRAVDDPDNATVEAKSAVMQLGSGIELWWNESEGAEIVKSQLLASPEGEALLDRYEDGDEDAAKELGTLIGAAAAEDWEKPLTTPQKDVLRKYGLYDEEKDTRKQAEAKTAAQSAATDLFKTGDYDYGSLPEAYKEHLDEKAFDALVVNYVVDKVTQAGGIVNSDGSINISQDDLEVIRDSGDLRFVSKPQPAAITTVVTPKRGGRLYEEKDKPGLNDNRLTKDVVDWYQSNKGKLVEVNGKWYVPIAIDKSRVAPKAPYINFLDVETNTVKRINNVSDWSK